MSADRPRQPPVGQTALIMRPTSRVDFKIAAQQVIAAKKSPHTRAAYTRDLDGWLLFCGHERIDPKSPTLSDATHYRDSLIGSEDTRRRRLASLSTIYSTLRKLPDEHNRPIVSTNPFHPEILAWPKAGKVLKSRRISDDQAIAIVQAASENARDFAVLCLLRDTGWRRTAIASLPRSNYDGRRVYNRQKGDKEQEVELPDETVAAIDRWLRERRTSDYLFPADDNDGHVQPGHDQPDHRSLGEADRPRSPPTQLPRAVPTRRTRCRPARVRDPGRRGALQLGHDRALRRQGPRHGRRAPGRAVPPAASRETMKLLLVQRRLLERAARHTRGRVVGNDDRACALLVEHGLLKPDGFNRVGSMFKITAAGRKAIVKVPKGDPAVPRTTKKTPRSQPRVALAFKACKDGSLIIHAEWPDGRGEHWWDSEPIRIEPHRVSDVLSACGDALAKKPRVR